MAAYFHSINLNGFANWMRVQAQEEMFHALKFFDFILDRGGSVNIGAISQPPEKWESILACFEASLMHEEMVTDWINQLADLTIKEGDHATHIFMQWYITEQVEEEKNVNDIVSRLKLAKDSPGGLFLLDNELKQRVFTAPATQA